VFKCRPISQNILERALGKSRKACEIDKLEGPKRLVFTDAYGMDKIIQSDTDPFNLRIIFT
jgi:hypothetical protein